MPDAAFAIEPLGPATRAGAVALIRRLFPDEPLAERISVGLIGTPLQFVTRALGVVNQRLWVAVAGGAVVGVTGLYDDCEDIGEAVWLGWFGVAPEARGRGIGAALLDFSIARARETGRRALRLYTSTDAAERSAQALYDSRGLVVVERHQPDDWREEGVWSLTRELRLR